MIAALRRAYDEFAGRGESAVTIPAMDGALRPNHALDDAVSLLAVFAPDNLVVQGDSVLFSSGPELWRIEGGTSHALVRHPVPIACLATASDGGLAIGFEDGRISLPDSRSLDGIEGRRCPTALAFDGDALVVAQGSTRHPPSGWKHDVMERGSTGSVWRVPMGGGAAICLADGLAFPYGLLVDGGSVLVSESWRHRVLRLDARQRSRPDIVLTDLPGYPARLAPAEGGGAWLCIFAPRSQLMELVLRERLYRRRMMAEVDPDYWVAPALASGRSFLEPLQGGAVKQMGILKPWAPARSYGLVLRLDAGWEPVASLHSRADGVRHGVTCCVEHGGALLVASKGGDAILSVGV